MALATASPPAPEAAASPALRADEASRPPAQGRGAVVLGAVLLVAAEAMLLAAMLAVYFAIKGGAPRWPPRGVRVGTYLPTIVTITAMMSAVSVQWALHAIRRHDQRNAAVALGLTVLFGLAMANAEWYSLTRAGFGVRRHAYGTLYHSLLGFHVAHLLLGVVVLLVVAGRALAGHFSARDHEPVKASCIVWQFGNVAWGLLLLALVVLPRV